MWYWYHPPQHKTHSTRNSGQTYSILPSSKFHCPYKSPTDNSSDHDPILLEVNSTPIASSPPSAKRFINRNKYANILTNCSVNSNPSTSNLTEIDLAIDSFTSTILTTVESSFSAMKPHHLVKGLPSYVQNEIRHKNRLRREGQRNRDPVIKRCLNAKINVIRTLLSTYKQDEWDKFLDTLNYKQNSIYLINKRPSTHPLSGPNGLVFSATDKAELVADSFVL